MPSSENESGRSKNNKAKICNAPSKDGMTTRPTGSNYSQIKCKNIGKNGIVYSLWVRPL